MPTAKSLAPESEEDELSSSEEVVDQGFNKQEFLLRFQENMATAMSAAMSKVISKLLEQPAKTCRNKQHRKHLCEEKAMPPPKTACKTGCKATRECAPAHTVDILNETANRRLG